MEGSQNIQALSTEELVEIEGGQTVFYYIFYGLGWGAHAYYDSQLSITTGTGSNMRR